VQIKPIVNKLPKEAPRRMQQFKSKRREKPSSSKKRRLWL
jgi:hypothetical protein